VEGDGREEGENERDGKIQAHGDRKKWFCRPQ